MFELKRHKAPPSRLRRATSPMQVIGEIKNCASACLLPIDLRWGGGSAAKRRLTEGPAMRPAKSSVTVKRAKRFRRELTIAGILVVAVARTSHHPAINSACSIQRVLSCFDFFCALSKLWRLRLMDLHMAQATGPRRDVARDAWLAEHRIDTLRIPAIRCSERRDRSCECNYHATVEDRTDRASARPLRHRLRRMPTSPSQVDGEDKGITK